MKTKIIAAMVLICAVHSFAQGASHAQEAGSGAAALTTQSRPLGCLIGEQASAMWFGVGGQTVHILSIACTNGLLASLPQGTPGKGD